MKHWDIHEAQTKFLELVKQSGAKGPQSIAINGESVAVIISCKTFDRLSENHKSLMDFMQASPLYDVEAINLERNQSLTREVDW